MSDDHSDISLVKDNLIRCQRELDELTDQTLSGLIRDYIKNTRDFLKQNSSITRDDLVRKENTLREKVDAPYVMIANKIILYSSYHDNFKNIGSTDLPDGVVSYIREDFERSLKLASANDSTMLSFSHNQFKIYADTLNSQMIPVGNQGIILTGFSRNRIIQPTVRQSGSFLLMLLRLGGNKPLYEMHFNPHRMRLFTEDGWKNTFNLIAEVLARKPEVKGVFGGSWFFDPDVLRVSPEMSYLHSMVKRLGGSFFYSSKTERDKQNAFAMSAKRRRAYDEGTYEPKSYLALIPRRTILRFFGINDHG